MNIEEFTQRFQPHNAALLVSSPDDSTSTLAARLDRDITIPEPMPEPDQ